MTVQALETPVVARLAGMPRSTLDYWARTGLVTPSVRPSSGRRRAMLWSVRDAVTVRAVKVLRDAGAPLQRVRAAKRELERGWGEALGKAVLIWDGADVLRLGTWGELSSLLKHPGQHVLHAVALPVGAWRAEAEAEAVTLPSQPHKPQAKARSA